MFVDSVEIDVKAGNGGNGAVSFRHEKYVDKGGPNGGDGGHGGDVILQASTRENGLANYRIQQTWTAESGQNGRDRDKHGRKGKDLIVSVPVGTQITDASTGALLADLTEDQQKFVICKGGHGGFGNAHFVSSTRQAPLVAEKGSPGEEKTLRLELKILADVGLLGLPNAGKSTFLSVVSNARPEIADYPFTTLAPSLGVVDVGGDSLLIADIPGLIRGAHKGKGLGFEFLRHVERNKVLLHLVDIYNEDIADAYLSIREELAKYSRDLANLPEVVALTKTEGFDQEMLEDAVKKLKKVVKKGTIIRPISSAAHTGLDELLTDLKVLVDASDDSRQEELVGEEENVYRLSASERSKSEWSVQLKRGKYTVTGPKIERFANKTYFDDYYSVERLKDIMQKLGIAHELNRQGYTGKEVVIFGNPEIGRLTGKDLE